MQAHISAANQVELISTTARLYTMLGSPVSCISWLRHRGLPLFKPDSQSI